MRHIELMLLKAENSVNKLFHLRFILNSFISDITIRNDHIIITFLYLN
jgi:hypothetical protein